MIVCLAHPECKDSGRNASIVTTAHDSILGCRCRVLSWPSCWFWTRMRKLLTAKIMRPWNIRVEVDPNLLCLLWLAGACTVGTSILAIQILTLTGLRDLDEKFEPEDGLRAHQEQLTVTIYTAPAPFQGNMGIEQAVAINSWLRLDPSPRVVLLGRHPSLRVFASTRAPNVTVDTNLDFTFGGRPFFHGMIRRARTCSSDIVMLIDPDLILFHHVSRAIQSMRNFDHDWLITALPLVVTEFPFTLEGPSFEASGASVQEEEVKTYVRHHGIWDASEGPQLWAWNGNESPLHAGLMPPFVYKEGHHQHWLLSEAITSKYRVVLDASEAFTMFRKQIASGISYDTYSISAAEKERSSRVYNRGNFRLASTYGSYYFKAHLTRDPSHKLLNCARMKSEIFGIVNMSHEPCTCYPLCPRLTLEKTTWLAYYHPAAWISWFRTLVGWNELDSVARSWGISRSNAHPDLYSTQKDEKNRGIIDTDFAPSLESLLSRVSSSHNVVILAVVGNSYRDMLMSWVCRFRHLNVSNYLVSALDDDLFQFAAQQGLPVFRTSADMTVSRNTCHFGTDCFQRVTKMKSRTVLQILRLGFHVLFSDVDVYWFEDPSKELMSFGPGHLPAQTDQWNETEAFNTPRHLNSGFYFAWADNRTVAAFENIIKHAANSKKSEQASFYDVLCGEGGKYTVGSDTCLEPKSNVTVHFLDPVKYPNGAFGSLWVQKDVRNSCEMQGCKVLHNNWIPGRQNKLNRQMASGLWDYDVATRMCLTTIEAKTS